MKPTFFKGALVGGIAGAVMAAGTVALAGSGIGAVFNLGQENTVSAQTLLKGTTSGNPQLKVNNQAGSDAAIAVHGVHSSGVGTGPGVRGETSSSSPNATGILAQANATNAGRDNVALRAINKNTNQYGMGVWASIAGAGWGVLGEAGPYGIGVIGKQAGIGTGVHGQAGPGGVGVRGTGFKGAEYGVLGEAGDGVGVRGTGAYGGYFSSSGPNGKGVLSTAGTNGIAVHGQLSGAGTGVYGSTGVNGVGVKGEAGLNGAGVKGVGHATALTPSWAGQFIGDVDVQGHLKLRVLGVPPDNDCIYNFHRGRIEIVTDNTNTWLYVCGPAGWRYVYLR